MSDVFDISSTGEENPPMWAAMEGLLDVCLIKAFAVTIGEPVGSGGLVTGAATLLAVTARGLPLRTTGGSFAASTLVLVLLLKGSTGTGAGTLDFAREAFLSLPVAGLAVRRVVDLPLCSVEAILELPIDIELAWLTIPAMVGAAGSEGPSDVASFFVRAIDLPLRTGGVPVRVSESPSVIPSLVPACMGTLDLARVDLGATEVSLPTDTALDLPLSLCVIDGLLLSSIEDT